MSGNDRTAKHKTFDISKECSKCPILIKEVAVVKDIQFKIMAKLDELIITPKWENRLETLEKSVSTILTILLEKSMK
jgi:hypothetical protein